MECTVCKKEFPMDQLTPVNGFSTNDHACPACLSSMTVCSVCGYSRFFLSDVEGHEGLCDCCSANRHSEEINAQWDRELAIFNKRAGTNCDFADFCGLCEGEEVDINHLKRLPELKRIHRNIISEQAFYLESLKEKQKEIPFDGDDLPF